MGTRMRDAMKVSGESWLVNARRLAGIYLLLCFFLLGCSKQQPKAPPKPLTEYFIHTIYVSVRFIEDDRQMPIKAIIAGEQANGAEKDLNVIITTVLTLQIEFTNPKLFTTNHPPRFADAWGMPLIMAWKDEATVIEGPTKAMAVHDNLIIYSVGPNGIDEKGQGDDVWYVPHSNPSSERSH